MSFIADRFNEFLKQMQAEGNIVLPGELVRRVKAGPGPDSLGQAQHAALQQSTEQQGIESDTLTAVGRLEAAWSGQSGDAARGSLKPLADVATSASLALHDSQNTLADQGHAFTSTRDSMQDVSDDPPSRSGWDVATPWDTDNEDKINQRNAAVQQNNSRYQEYTSTSDGHAQKMPVDYGQVPDSSDGTYGLAPQQGPVEHPVDPQKESSTPYPSSHSYGQTDQRGSGTAPQPGSYAPQPGHGGVPGGQQQPQPYVPAAAYDDGTRTSGYVPPSSTGVGNTPLQFGPGGTAYVPSTAPGGSSSYNSPGYLGGVPASFGPVGGTGAPGSGGSGPGGPGSFVRGGSGGAPGQGGSSGAGRFGEPEPGARGGAAGTGVPGAKGANGMPMAGGAGKGGKGEEDKEKKAASYLQEADPNSLFGYDGKATPPVIGK
ncbi:hypothetical protein G3I59_28650 [Amycolatopsis rubida]|uniref:PPE family protein n=1 Tax=Amycolatopsis rubida TaxID=112413 RepID=A0ABX0BZ41_9PSEU|nr:MULTISPECIES: hypothetical protein [Amycolatopsis]MYW94456.1 hypothetical protein [Amycolatopsis rubida]NEC59444.1 hypothetical protein [Amycolatopsis rubida]OAP27168.1 hypothetical protein A4R44_01977 [Amycolatopsis sp. M39]